MESMNEENRPLVTDELIELEITSSKGQGFRNITKLSRGIYRIFINFINKKPQDVQM